MTAPVPYATGSIRDLVPDQTSASGLVTNTTSNALRALLDNPRSVTGTAPTQPTQTGASGNPVKGSPNPWGLGITAFEPNTAPFIHELGDSLAGAMPKVGADTVANEYASASADVTEKQREASDAAVAKTVNPAGDFAAGGVTDASGKVSAFINAALAAASRGIPYVWGGTNLNSGVDCSGLIYAAAQAAGITDWKRYVAADYGKMPQVDPRSARAGDIVFWSPGQNGVGPTGHVGIYIGNGMMVAAPQSGETVKVERVFGTPTFHRIFDDSSFGTVVKPDGSYAASYNGRATPWAQQASSAIIGRGLQPFIDALGGSRSPLASMYGSSARFAAAEHGDTLYGGGPAEANYTGTSSRLKVNVPYANLFTTAGAKYGISPALLAAVAKNESSFNPGAHSGAGAVGLMQFMPGTAQGLGINPLDPAQAVDGAARMLLGLYRQFGSWDKALWAYNAGSGNVRAGRVPSSTVQYANKVLATAQQYGG